MSVAPLLAAAWRIVFLTVSAPLIGGVLLAAIGRVTGARWQAALSPPLGMRLVIVGAALLGAAQATIAPPPHLAVWMSPLLVGLRAVIAAGLLAFAGARLAAGGSATGAGITLAVYAACVTPVAMDWLLGAVPGHAVSSAGMLVFVEQIAGACALVLVLGRGDARLRADLAKLMIAAALGLAYLIFMDFLILWFGNLPARVGFYAVRSPVPVWIALVVGLIVPVAALVGHRERIAGAAVLIALFVVNGWWVGATAAVWLVALATLAGIVVVARYGARGRG